MSCQLRQLGRLARLSAVFTLLGTGVRLPAQPPAAADVHGDPLPAGAVAQLGAGRLHHSHGYLPGVDFAPDGRTLVTAGMADGIRLWDAATGKLLRRAATPVASSCLRVSPDGRWAVVEGRDGFTLWDLRTGDILPVRIDGGSQLSLSLLTFSPAGDLVAAHVLDRGTAGRDVRLWEVPSGRQRLRLAGPAAASQLAFADGGNTLVSADARLTVCRHDTRTGELRQRVTVPHDEAGVPTLSCLSPDGRWLAVAPRHGEPAVWDTATGQRRCVLKDFIPFVGGLDFAADGHSLAAAAAEPGGGPHIGIWDAATGQRLRRFALPKAGTWSMTPSVRLAPGGRTASVYGPWGGPVRLYDTTTGTPRPRPDGHESPPFAFAGTPDGARLVSADLSETRLWDLAAGRSLWVTATPPLAGLALAPDRRSIVTCTRTGQITVRDVESGRAVRDFTLPRPGESVSGFGLTADGRSAVVLYPVRRPAPAPALALEVWDLASGATGPRPTELPVATRVTVAPGGRYVAGYAGAGADQQFILFDRLAGRVRPLFPPAPRPGPAAVTPNGRTVARAEAALVGRGTSAQVDRWHLRLGETASGADVFDLPADVPGDAGGFDSLLFTPDGRTLAAARRDRTLLVIDVATGRERLRLGGFDAAMTAAAFTAGGRRLVTGHADGTILVWDTAATPPPPAAVTAAQLDGWWADLAANDAARANAAVWSLAAAPERAVPLLAERVRPDATAPAEQMRKLIADLDSPRFAVREAAQKALAELGEAAVPSLRAALVGNPSPEVRQRLLAILDRPSLPSTPEGRRHLRAVQVLEVTGTPEAAQVLERWAGGTMPALAREAREALERLRGNREEGPMKPAGGAPWGLSHRLTSSPALRPGCLGRCPIPTSSCSSCPPAGRPSAPARTPPPPPGPPTGSTSPPAGPRRCAARATAPPARRPA
jgi:WD40 repeat protein